MEKVTTKLRRLLAGPGCVVAPGVADGLAARLVKLAGFDACYMTGFGTSLTRLGMPDVGLLTATEMIDNASRIAEASNLPVIADADTGYGNPINTRRTIRDYEKAGVAGVHIEDQSWPKRCGHLAGKKVIPTAEMVAKIKAKFGYDDALDAFGVHGMGGTLGAILTGVFATKEVNDLRGGMPMGLVDGNSGQVMNQLIASAFAWVIAIVGTLVILKIVDAIFGLRTTDAEETEGLDLSMHGEEGYHFEG